MNDEFKIQLKVAGRVYPLRCKRSEEWIFRRAAAIVNDRILKYGAAFAGANLELNDLLVMVSLHAASESVRRENEANISPVFDRIEELDNELKEYLRSNGK